jgi:protein-tyrosine phosphatase
MGGWRQAHFRIVGRFYRPRPDVTWLSWIGDHRIAIGTMPTHETLRKLRDNGVTHVVNCRSTLQTWISQDLGVERDEFGASCVVHAPMWDFGRAQPFRLWSAAAQFCTRVLAEDERARVLIHCHQGRRRSSMLTYAVLRLLGHPPDEAAALIASHRLEAELVRAYLDSVERWLATGTAPPA